MTLSFLPRPRALALVVAAVALPVAGCGGASSSAGGDAGADPASALPASAPLYVEAQVRPQGEQRTGAVAVGRKLLHTSDPAGKVIAMFDKAIRDKGASFEHDVDPWLGNRVGLAVTSLRGQGDADYAVAIASKDDDKAKAFVADRAQRDKAAEREYHGVKYAVDPRDHTAAAVLGHTVVVATEPAMKAAIDASKGDSLSEAKGFREARDAVGTDGLGFAYADPKRLFDAALSGLSSGSGGATQAQALSGLLGGSGLRSIAASLDVAPNALRLDAALVGAKSVSTGAGDGPAAAAAAPADAWLSAGIGDLGGTLRKALAQQGSSGSFGGFSLDQLQRQLKGGLGVDLDKDFLSWMGDASLFVRGTSQSDLGGALVIASKDPAASHAAIAKIDKLLTTFGTTTQPLTGVAGAEGLTLDGPGSTRVEIAAKGDKFVIALGHGAVAAALGGGGTVGDTAAFKGAAALLEGAKPSFFLDTPTAVKLLASFAGGKADFQTAKPTLDVFGPAAAGMAKDGDTTHVKAAVGIR